jgi:hypothetical protein|tara:strand:- start:9495 stop:9899 length:405 start_codon:yes stop_codon:yes gene_type:complete
MVISGKIYSITQITNDITNIVLLKTRNKTPYYVSIMFYYHISDVIKKTYTIGDFIKIWFRVRSNQRITGEQVRYYTDIIGEKTLLIRRDGVKIKKIYSDNTGMPVKDMYVFEETGEIVEKHTVKNSIKNNPNRE